MNLLDLPTEILLKVTSYNSPVDHLSFLTCSNYANQTLTPYSSVKHSRNYQSQRICYCRSDLVDSMTGHCNRSIVLLNRDPVNFLVTIIPQLVLAQRLNFLWLDADGDSGASAMYTSDGHISHVTMTQLPISRDLVHWERPFYFGILSNSDDDSSSDDSDDENGLETSEELTMICYTAVAWIQETKTRIPTFEKEYFFIQHSFDLFQKELDSIFPFLEIVSISNLKYVFCKGNTEAVRLSGQNPNTRISMFEHKARSQFAQHFRRSRSKRLYGHIVDSLIQVIRKFPPPTPLMIECPFSATVECYRDAYYQVMNNSPLSEGYICEFMLSLSIFLANLLESVTCTKISNVQYAVI